MNINELTTYFENLLKAGKIISTKENLKKVLRATFLDKDGMPLSKETLNSYFNPSKKYNRSKKG